MTEQLVEYRCFACGFRGRLHVESGQTAPQVVDCPCCAFYRAVRVLAR